MAHFTWIEENILAASSCPSVEELADLRGVGISAIVTLTEDSLEVKTGMPESELIAMGFTLLHAPIIDYHAPDETAANRVIKFVDQMKAAGKPVLIHCQAGQERTGTLLHVYYLSSGFTLKEASTRIRAVRPQSAFEKLMPVQQVFLQAFAGKLR